MRSFDKISFVPIHKRDDSDLLANEAAIMSDMQNPNQRIAVCVHEAAHGVYFKSLGARRLQYYSCRATYLKESDSFRYAYAGIEAFDFPPGISPALLDATKPYVAGDVAKRALADPEANVSDAYDKEKFLRDAPQSFPGVTGEQLEQVWQQAIITVERELKDNHALRVTIWEEAYKFEAWLLAND